MITKQFFSSEDYKNCMVSEEFLSISCCFFERSRLSDVFSHAYFDSVKSKCCVYMLWNKTETNPTVYIGKASYNCVINRLRNHNREKDFWKNAVVFSSDIFADADIEWIEATLINKARKYERCNLYNKKEEDYNDKLNESNRQETARKVSWFVKNVLRNKLGIDIFLSLENSWQTSKPFALLSYYEMLEIGMTSSVDEVKKAYKAKSLQYHPDRNSGSAESQDKMRLINEAYEVLTDNNKRKNYDSKIISEEMAADRAAEERRRAEQARRQQEESRRQQQEQARRQNDYQQQYGNYSYQSKPNGHTNADVAPEIKQYKKYDTFFYGAASSTAALFLVFSPLVCASKTTDFNENTVQFKMSEWRTIATETAQLRKDKESIQEKLNLLEDSWAQRMKQIDSLKADAINREKEAAAYKKEAEDLKNQAKEELKHAKMLDAEAAKKVEELANRDDISKKQNETLLLQAEETKQKSIALHKQAEEKLAGVSMQEKINLEFRNEALSKLKADCDKLQKNIAAYDKATGGFIDVFQNRLPSSAVDVQKSTEMAKEALKIFNKDAELSMQLDIAKTLLEKAKKRVLR